MEFYLSQLLGKPVVNQSNEKIGVLEDLVTSDMAKNMPRISGLLVKRGIKKGLVFIPEHDWQITTPKLIKLSTDLVDLTPFKQREEEILLKKSVYDMQVVDIDDRRLTRVNDILLTSEHEILRLKGVDVSMAGILSRLNIFYPQFLIKRNIVDWEDVQFLGGGEPIKFKIQYHNLESLHPVDIARIIFEGPGYKLGSRVISGLKDPIAADILEELSPQLQKNLVESMKIEDVADVIEHMSAHKAADLLVALGPVYAQKVLPFIDKKHAGQIQSLLNYPQHSCGAFMTTDFIAVSGEYTVEKALEIIKDREPPPDFLFYVYVIENEYKNRLIGVMDMKELLTADRRNRISSIMKKDIITIHPHDPVKEALKRMYRYNISAIPVVSRTEHKLLGIVTFRDAITIYLPKKWKVRIRHVLSNGN